MKTLHFGIILASTFLFLTLGTHNIFASQEFTLSSLPVNLSTNPPVIIDQVELDSAFAFFPDNQTCYNKPGFLANYTCSTSLVPSHKVQCGYFIGSSYCEPIHQYTSGTRQACLDLNLVPHAPQWFDMYNTQNKTVQIRLFYLIMHQGTGPWGQEGVFPTMINLGPYEKCTYAFGPVDEPLSLDQTNMSMVAYYTYGTKNYTVSTPALTDIQNDSRTWQLDGSKWVFAEQNTVQAPKIPILPLRQFKSGIPLSNIQCAQDLSLVIKAEDGSPACVMQKDLDKLIERGWGTVVGTTNKITSTNVCGQFYTAPGDLRQSNAVPVLLMNSNSTACTRLTFTIISNYKDCNFQTCQNVVSLDSTLRIGNLHYEKHDNMFSVSSGKDYTNSFNITTIPHTIDLDNYPIGANFTVTYIIKPLPNATGFYDQSIPKLACERYPLAVGYTADQVNTSDFSYIDPLNPPCAAGVYTLTRVEISGMDYKQVTLGG